MYYINPLDVKLDDCDFDNVEMALLYVSSLIKYHPELNDRSATILDNIIETFQHMPLSY